MLVLGFGLAIAKLRQAESETLNPYSDPCCDMAKIDNAWTRSPSRINLKIIFLQNYQFFMNYAKGPIKIHLLEAEKKTFDPWSIKRVASLCQFSLSICLQ